MTAICLRISMHPLRFGTSLERIGDESLTLQISRFVHPNILYDAEEAELDAESVSNGKCRKGRVTVNLLQAAETQVRSSLHKHKILLGKFDRLLTAAPCRWRPGINTSTKPGTNQRRISDIAMFPLRSPLHLVFSTACRQTAHTLSTARLRQDESSVNRIASN